METAKRARCEACCFLVEQCVCPWIPHLSTKLQVLILQDPKEAKHAKNTVSLLSLALPSVVCLSISSHDEMKALLSQKDRTAWKLVFPCEDAVPIESSTSTKKADVEGLILIDATWRKAKKLYLTEPILREFGAVSFAQPPLGRYTIRKSPNEHALSTLEACAYAIEQVTGENMQPLRLFMAAAQEWQWRQQPLNHRHKNES
ncbi:tRNA-uridine aminocarboxypropyltransferase [Marinomonas sp.]|uniref:tRNA-uridine aminocarboxypropyltransferase n=1 Tax=Marinomonas sp. TaxID=1904862 RepID=UPI003A94150A